MKRHQYITLIALFILPLLIAGCLHIMTSQGVATNNLEMLNFVDTIVSVWTYFGYIYWFAVGIFLAHSTVKKQGKAMAILLLSFLILVAMNALIFNNIITNTLVTSSVKMYSLSFYRLSSSIISMVSSASSTSLITFTSIAINFTICLIGYLWKYGRMKAKNFRGYGSISFRK